MFENLEGSGEEELGLVGGDRGALPLQAVFQNHQLVALARSLMDGVHRGPEVLRRVLGEPLRGLEDASRDGPVAVEARPELLGRLAESDRLAGHRDRAVTDDAVEAEAGEVEDGLGEELATVLKLVIEPARAGLLGLGLAGVEEVERGDLAVAGALDFPVAVAPAEDVAHEALAEPERVRSGDARVRLAVEPLLDRMVERDRLAAAALPLVDRGGEAGEVA